MNSTSASNKILEISNLDLVFNSHVYKEKSLRQSFVDQFKNPLGLLQRNTNSLHVLKGVSLSLNQGDRLGVLGCNGSGKTTLCRVISGMLGPTKGQVKLDGHCRAIFNTAIGILPQLTGRENAQLLSVLMFPELEKKEREELVEEAIEFSELGDFIDTPFVHYSKGMQSRLSLSIISARVSDLLILDEVFDGADMFFREKITKRILDLIEKSGATILVSHNLDQIRLACNKVLVLADGRKWFLGDIEEGIKLYSSLG